jgi:hypothetical protein
LGSIGIYNSGGTINTGTGRDIITGTSNNYGIYNTGTINTGDDSDIIAGTSTTGGGYGIYNDNTIDTGAGNDIIIGTSNNYGIYNTGTINTGNGEDSIIADGGFNGTGSVLLGEGKDYLKGFGSGNFNGGNAQDALELTSGSYTVGRSGTTVNFTKGGSVMNASEFEILIAGPKIYNFASLTAGQTIVVA